MRKLIAACYFFLASIPAIGFAQTNCGENFVNYNGTCKPLRTTSNKPAPFVPTAVTNREGIVLYPNVMPAKCATAQADSDCVTTYSYTDTSLPATISASFSKLSPIAGQESSVLTWTTGNAVTLSLYCSGVASIYNSPVALQNNTTGITFSSQNVGAHTCTFTAINPFGTSSSASFTVNFVAPLPRPTITFTRTPLPLVAGTNHSAVWNTSNATSVSGVCTSTGTGYTYTGPLALSGNNTSMTSAAWVGYPTRCVWTAVGPGGSASVVDEFSTVAPITPLPTITVSRINGLPMKYPGTTGSVWSSTNATSVTLGCTSSNGGYTQPVTSMGISGTGGGATLSSWIGKTSTCTWTANGPAGSATYVETLTTTTSLTNVWRLNGGGFYYYTPSAATRDALAAAYGWTKEGAGFAVSLSAGASLLPTNQYYNSLNGSRFWTNDPTEISQAPGWAGTYLEISPVWYAQHNNAANGAVPLYRFYIPASDSYFYTASYAEYAWVVANIPSWYPDGTTQYVWPPLP